MKGGRSSHSRGTPAVFLWDFAAPAPVQNSTPCAPQKLYNRPPPFPGQLAYKALNQVLVWLIWFCLCMYNFTVRLRVMQCMILQFCLSVRLSDACIVTKRNNRPSISEHHTKLGYL